MSARDEAAVARRHASAVAARETRAALTRWRRHPREIAPWVAISTLLAAILLLATLIVAGVVTPQPRLGANLIAADPSARFSDFLFVLGHNSAVLALHAMVCLATYLARRSLPLQAEKRSGVRRAVHRHATAPALAVVAALTLFSILQQALALGHSLADVAASRHTSPVEVLVRLLPHAIPELIAVFLPLAAVLWLGREGRWHDLLGATIACVVVALPVVVFSAWVEVDVASAFF